MKLLIIAGPYEADRIRRAAVAAEFEAVAVEPGESLSGWITATRPDVIVLAPKIVSSDPAVALGKVRAVPRGRVPIFLVGDADDLEHLQGLADGVVARPVVPEDLFARARSAMGLVASRGGEEPASGPQGRGPGSDPQISAPGSGPHGVGASGEGARDAAAKAPPTLRPLVAAAAGGPVAGSGEARGSAEAGGRGKAAAAARKTSERWPPAEAVAAGVNAAPTRVAPPAAPDLRWTSAYTSTFLDSLAATIEADVDAEIRDAVRAVGVLRRRESGSLPAVAPTPSSPLLATSPPSTFTSTSTSTSVAANHGAERRLVQDRHALVIEGDYFQILGASRDADSNDIAEAYRRTMSELAEQALHPAIRAEFEAELAEIRALATEAVRLLGDEALRATYRAHLLPSPADPVTPPPPPQDGENAVP